MCTGGSLLVNTTGRTDLLGLELADELARSQWRSVRRLLKTLPTGTRILPTHGFGSFCSATPGSGDLTAIPTIAEELARNPAALLDEDDFVAKTLSSLPPIPAYYRHMAPLNRLGRGPLLEPVAMLDTAGRSNERISSDRWVVDLRGRRVFAAGHLPGTLNLELGQNLTTYLGWLVPWESEFVLLADEEEEIAEARRLLARIGRDELYARAIWSTAGPTSREAWAKGEGDRTLRGGELFGPGGGGGRRAGRKGCRCSTSGTPTSGGGHLASARLLPLPELAARRHEVPPAGKVWLYCGAGYRVAVAASLLSGWGASPVLVDDAWENALLSGLAIEAD